MLTKSTEKRVTKMKEVESKSKKQLKQNKAGDEEETSRKRMLAKSTDKSNW